MKILNESEIQERTKIIEKALNDKTINFIDISFKTQYGTKVCYETKRITTTENHIYVNYGIWCETRIPKNEIQKMGIRCGNFGEDFTRDDLEEIREQEILNHYRKTIHGAKI